MHPPPFHQLPEDVFNDILVQLSMHEIRALRMADRWCEHRVLKLHTWSGRVHDIWEKNKPTLGYRLHRLRVMWYQSPVLRMAWWLGGGFLIPIACGFGSFPLWAVATFTCDGAHPRKQSHFVVQIEILRKQTLMGGRLEQALLPKGAKPNGLVALESEGGIGHPFHPFNLYANLVWLICGGLVLSLAHVLVALLQAFSIVGIPNVGPLLLFSRVFLWPFGFEYFLTPPEHLPPVDPRLSSLRLFLKVRAKEQAAAKQKAAGQLHHGLIDERKRMLIDMGKGSKKEAVVIDIDRNPVHEMYHPWH